MPATPKKSKRFGGSAAHQRLLVEAIKRARNIAFLPFAAD